MKLKCNDHARRVMVLDSGKVIHRNDGTECSQRHLMMGTERLTNVDIVLWDLRNEPTAAFFREIFEA